ncbi:hypothetical protein SASPL_121025 [Salvia splendens]|uniref:Uncharacterized protein n=1 Tax=Salvia splendens TaxID=180675 RepID=A0A8X8XVC3_SALSN|nr:hypothetical protein SASPL_121025 [Salvia splendens]
MNCDTSTSSYSLQEHNKNKKQASETKKEPSTEENHRPKHRAKKGAEQEHNTRARDLGADLLSNFYQRNHGFDQPKAKTLSLRYNALSGPLPPYLFTSFRNLYLQHNFFTGELPQTLFSLTSLVRLNLAENNFLGPISPGFANLTKLGTLYLQKNRFSGPIPPLDLPALVQFDVSSNNLTGSIPNSLSKNPKSSFLSNSLCGEPLNSCGNANPKKKKLSAGAIAGIVIASVVAVLTGSLQPRKLIQTVGIYTIDEALSLSAQVGLNRSGESYRLRCVNYLRPGLKKGLLTPQEEGHRLLAFARQVETKNWKSSVRFKGSLLPLEQWVCARS